MPASAPSTRASRRIVSSLLARLCGGGRRSTNARVAAAEPHEHVLGAAGDQLDVGDRAVPEAALVHPRGDPVEVDDGGIEHVGHGRRSFQTCSNRTVPELVDAIRADLAAAADPTKAPAMQAYMKSAMPYRGVPTPERRRLAREPSRRRRRADRSRDWQAIVTELWDGATHREERYVAVDLCAMRPARPWQDADLVPLYDHFVVTGAWWDHVDAVAIALLGPILRADRPTVEPIVRGWITDDDLWRRRTSIIIQNGAKAATDDELLADAIVANLDDRDFFIRKAIGWALREQAKSDPAGCGRSSPPTPTASRRCRGGRR